LRVPSSMVFRATKNIQKEEKKTFLSSVSPTEQKREWGKGVDLMGQTRNGFFSQFTQLGKGSGAGLQVLDLKCWTSGARAQVLELRCWSSGAGAQVLELRCSSSSAGAQVLDLRC
jgi:hypothetical protein